MGSICLSAVDRFTGRFGHHREGSPLFPNGHFFAHRSLLLHCTARETYGGTTDHVIDSSATFEELVLRYIEDDRSSCSIGVLAAFDGLDDGAAKIEPIFGPFGAPNSARKQKVAKMVG